MGNTVSLDTAAIADTDAEAVFVEAMEPGDNPDNLDIVAEVA